MKKTLITWLMATAFVALQAATVINFDDYTVNQMLSGQDGWVVADGVIATPDERALSTIRAGGLIGNTTGNRLEMTGTGLGAPGPKMDRWLQKEVVLTGDTYVSFHVNMSNAGPGSTDPSEFFLGFHTNPALNAAPWNAYIALKHPHPNQANPFAPGIETTASGGVIPNSKVKLDKDMHVVALFKVDEEDKLVNISVWINPNYDKAGSPDLSVTTPGTLDLTAQNILKTRAQNMPTKFDDLILGYTWDDVVPKQPLTSTVALVGSDVELSFPTLVGQRYLMEASTDGMQTWTPVTAAIDGDGGVQTLAYASGVPASGEKVFYRIVTAM